MSNNYLEKVYITIVQEYIQEFKELFLLFRILKIKNDNLHNTYGKFTYFSFPSSRLSSSTR